MTGVDAHSPTEADFCRDCPDHEACRHGAPCRTGVDAHGLLRAQVIDVFERYNAYAASGCFAELMVVVEAAIAAAEMRFADEVHTQHREALLAAKEEAWAEGFRLGKHPAVWFESDNPYRAAAVPATPSAGYCAGCPDHEACYMGAPCIHVKTVAAKVPATPEEPPQHAEHEFVAQSTPILAALTKIEPWSCNTCGQPKGDPLHQQEPISPPAHACPGTRLCAVCRAQRGGHR